MAAEAHEPGGSGRAGGLIPVAVVTGFLGSGKTTLINRWLRSPAFSDTVVIVNEFGDVGLDHLLFETAYDTAVLLENGCLCCTLRGDLADTLEDLARRRASGELPPFSRCVVETTGLADPVPIVRTFLTDERARRDWYLDRVVTVVDAVSGAGNLERQTVARHQAALADVMVISKVDLADGPRVAALAARLATVNPIALLLRSSGADLAPNDVFDAKPRPMRGHGGQEAHAHHADHDHGEGHDHEDGAAHAGVGSVTIERAIPVEWTSLARWLVSLAAFRGNDLLRLKGLAWVVGEDRPVVIQAVQHMVHPPGLLDEWPPDTVPATRLVAIGYHLDKVMLETSLDAFARPDAVGLQGAGRPGE
ncbi:MAG: GTP-binding protein [Alphaproteobacteria bacterium]|nr:GTP-binding protein [Alphaproteobacteria bacterium]